MTPRERESQERLEALAEALEEPGAWICQACSYVALYRRARHVHERQTGHDMKEDNGQ